MKRFLVFFGADGLPGATQQISGGFMPLTADGGGDEVFAFLQPWLQTLAAQVVEKRVPLYQLNPQDWEIRVVSQIGRDKQLPGAAFPGLAPAQQHRVYAMGRSIDVKGRTAIQGEPGTGKVRCVAA